MNRKLALVTLIKHSLLLPAEDKIALLKRVGDLAENDVHTLGIYLAQERQFIMENAQKIQEYAGSLVDYFSQNPMNQNQDNADKVYIGTGKAG